MYTLLVYPGGRRVEALLLSASPDRLRAVIPGCGDTLEFRMAEGRWTSDRGVPVEIGALLVDDRMSGTRFLSQHVALHTKQRTLSAG